MVAKVILGTMQNAKKLVNIAEHISCDVELCSGRYVVNAKSMLGVLSMPGFNVGELHIHTDEENECNRILEQLLENGLLADTSDAAKRSLYDITTFGEILIDFTWQGVNADGQTLFAQNPGGAPANVVGAVTKLGIPSKFLTKLGDDPFGDYIVEVLDEAGIDTSNIARDKEGETALAFVSLASDGNRDFKFYRKNSADLRYSVEDIPADILNDCGMIHFCSVDLVESPMKEAHKKLIDMAIAQNVKVSFDPNLRFSLWDDLDQLKETVNDFLKYADIIKISDEELEFITGHTDIKDALDGLFADRAKYVIYTKGADGAEVYTRNGMVEASGYKIDVRDTTGAGDSFIGAFLYCLLNDEVEDLESVSDDTLRNYLDFANAYAANTTTKEGALAAMADRAEMDEWMKTLKK